MIKLLPMVIDFGQEMCKMKKNITKDQIVYTALELMRDKTDLHGMNLREIARTLGCAHTNLYNYFSSYNDLLWETRATLQEILASTIEDRLAEAGAADLKLTALFEIFIDAYVDNKGWFRLVWHEHIAGERPQRDIEVTDNMNQLLHSYAIDICKEFSQNGADDAQIKQVLHNTMCYIAGEISNHISGRSGIQNEEVLKAHVSFEALNMFLTCLRLV